MVGDHIRGMVEPNYKIKLGFVAWARRLDLVLHVISKLP